jgi:hypothetical protein
VHDPGGYRCSGVSRWMSRFRLHPLMKVRMSSAQFIGRCWLTRAVFGTSSPHAAKRFAISTAIDRVITSSFRMAAAAMKVEDSKTQSYFWLFRCAPSIGGGSDNPTMK